MVSGVRQLSRSSPFSPAFEPTSQGLIDLGGHTIAPVACLNQRVQYAELFTESVVLKLTWQRREPLPAEGWTVWGAKKIGNAAFLVSLRTFSLPSTCRFQNGE